MRREAHVGVWRPEASPKLRVHRFGRRVEACRDLFVREALRSQDESLLLDGRAAIGNLGAGPDGALSAFVQERLWSERSFDRLDQGLGGNGLL